MSKNLLSVMLLLLTACSAAPGAIQPTATALPAARLQPTTTATSARASPPTSAKPNILFVLADDLDADSIRYMPRLKALLIDQGTTFSNFIFNISLCCPSRVTILRGQYAQNTRVYSNGIFEAIVESGLEKSTVAVWLHNAGYKTMLAGKYLNGYPPRNNRLYIPPGWDEWYSAVDGKPYGEYSYTLNENGKAVQYGSQPEDYGTDVYTRKATDFIARTAKEGKPFFIHLSFYAPHSPATPAPRHANLFPDAQAPRTPNYDEADVSDKPQYIRGEDLLTAQEQSRIDADYRKRLQSLQAVDEAIETLVNTLEATGQLENTYIFFGSDNGYVLGNHRLPQGKVVPYEESIRVPLIVRGPGVPAGQTVEQLVGNVDLAPTWAELAGVKVPDFVDGRSLVPLWSAHPPNEWRQAYLIMNGNPNAGARPQQSSDEDDEDPKGFQNPSGLRDKTRIPLFAGLRTKDYTYVEYVTGEKELYALKNDPYQLQNLAGKADAALLAQFSARLAELKRCAAATCRAAEDAALAAR